jgi:hypothetical protein
MGLRLKEKHLKGPREVRRLNLLLKMERSFGSKFVEESAWMFLRQQNFEIQELWWVEVDLGLSWTTVQLVGVNDKTDHRGCKLEHLRLGQRLSVSQGDQYLE